MSASIRATLLLTLAVLLLVGGASLAANPPAQIPNQALMLLPENPVAVVYLSSLDAVARTVSSVTASFQGADSSSGMDVLDFFPKGLGRIKDVIDRARPMVLVATLDLSYGAPEPLVTLLVPIVQGTSDAETLAMASGFASAQIQGDYLALSSIQDFHGSGQVPALLSNLAGGELVGRVDLETIFAITRPMIEMMMQSMQQKSANAPGGTAPPEAAYQLATALMNSARSLEFSLGEDEGSFELSLALDINARSVLDAGPQPPLEDALRLASYLPDYGEMIAINATDLSLLYQNLPVLSEMGDSKFAENLPEGERETARAWLKAASEKLRSLQGISASAARLHDGSLQCVQVAEVEDAGTVLRELDALLMSLPETNLGVQLVKLDTPSAQATLKDGVVRRDYSWEIDPNRLETVLGDSTTAAPSSEELAATANFAEHLLPRLHLVARGNRLLLCLLDDGPELDEVLKRFAGEGGTKPARLESLQSWAGSGVQVMSRIELRALARELLQIYSVMEGKEDIEIKAEPPVEIRYAGMVGGARYSMKLRADAKALMQLVAELKQAENARGGE